VEVLVVINAGEHEGEAVHRLNRQSLEAARKWQAQAARTYPYHFLYLPALPKKQAGVGLARKIGMDEAVDRLEQAGQAHGIILCLDADTTVAPNYLQAVQAHFRQHNHIQACSIYFEHPLEGTAFPEEVYEGIGKYELFLRYYIQAQRTAAYPAAFHTIGSAMAVRSAAYQQQGGMNRRKAGEDFYFLHKFIQLNALNELNETCVFPSPRPALKVPFGTGRAIHRYLQAPQRPYPAYAPASFEALGSFLQQLPLLYEHDNIVLPPVVEAFLQQQQFFQLHLPEIRDHVSSPSTFLKRFYRWFDALKVLQYVHFARDHFFPDVELLQAANHLLQTQLGRQAQHPTHCLQLYRQWQRGRPPA